VTKNIKSFHPDRKNCLTRFYISVGEPVLVCELWIWSHGPLGGT